MHVIELCGLTKDYGAGKGVFGLQLTVPQGEVLGFLGPNGAGKTTTIRQLMGFIRPDAGTARIRRLDCFQQAETIQASLGYLPGEIAFMDDMTGMDFIKFIAGMKGMKDLGRARELMDQFELDAAGKIKRMSKGTKQKIGIVCAFMQKPEILILDEPTSGLDPLMQNKFVELIAQEKQRGATIFMSSHMFEEVERTCDRAAIIEGRIVALEEMENLRQQAQEFEIVFADEAGATAFAAAFPGSTRSGARLQFAYPAVWTVLKTVAQYAVEDIACAHRGWRSCFALLRR
ncbi:MAG: ABC transporter ATP-binding protein [Oscillospiraceae bacterium]